MGGVLSRWEMYTRGELVRRLGLTESAYRALLKVGLPIIRIGKRVYFSGKQVIAFMEEQTRCRNA